MDPIEKAIRNALEKGDALDPAFRQRVYVSAEHALARSLAAHAAMAPADKHARIEKLRRIASQIEHEFTPATEPMLSPQSVSGEESWRVRPEPQRAQQTVETPVQAVRAKKNLREAPEDLVGVSAKSNRRLSRLFIFITTLAMIIMLGWLLWTSGIFDKPNDDSGNPAEVETSESSSDNAAPRLGAASDAEEGWISVFAPSDAAAIDLSGGLSADLKGTGQTAYVLLTAPEGQSGKSAASIEIGRGLLESLRGKKVVFDIKSKAGDIAGSQMSVACDLAGMGECQRTRFQLESQLMDNLVSVQLGDIAPEASGVLTISPSMEGKGSPIEIHSIRVRIADE